MKVIIGYSWNVGKGWLCMWSISLIACPHSNIHKQQKQLVIITVIPSCHFGCSFSKASHFAML